MTKLRKILNIAFLVLVLIFLIRYAFLHSEQIKRALLEVDAKTIIVCFALLIIGKFFLSLNMCFSVHLTGKKLDLLNCVKIYNTSQLGKYIPGTVFMLIGRVGMLKDAGIDGKEMRNSMIYEMAIVLGTAFLYGSFAIILTRASSLLSILMEYHVVLITFAIFTALSMGVVAFIVRKKKYTLISFPRLSARSAYLIVVNCLLIWGAIGVSYTVLSSTYIMSPMSFQLIIYLAGLYALAYSIGFCVPIAPAGIGVREGVIVLGLSGILPTEIAILSVTLHRVIYFAVDVLLGVFSLGFMRSHALPRESQG